MATPQISPTASFPRRHFRSFVTIAMAATMLGTLVLGTIPASAQIGDNPGGTGTNPDANSPLLRASTNPDLDAALAGASDVTAHATHNLNLRNGPSLQTTIQTVMPAGSTVEVTGEAQNGFYPVTFRDIEGFAFGDFLAEGAGAPPAPAPAPASEPAPAPAPAPASSASSGGGIVQVIYNAAAKYGQNGDAMLRVARCESGLNPGAVNRSSNASGLFQFLPSTWATTPYAGQNIFNPVANAEAAAWMWANGRRNEWVCQ